MITVRIKVEGGVVHPLEIPEDVELVVYDMDVGETDVYSPCCEAKMRYLDCDNCRIYKKPCISVCTECGEKVKEGGPNA